MKQPHSSEHPGDKILRTVMARAARVNRATTARDHARAIGRLYKIVLAEVPLDQRPVLWKQDDFDAAGYLLLHAPGNEAAKARTAKAIDETMEWRQLWHIFAAFEVGRAAGLGEAQRPNRKR